MRAATTLVNYIEERDHRLMRRCNRWEAPRLVRWASIYATRGGDGWFWYLLAAAVLALGGEERFRVVGAATCSAALGVALFLRLKKITGRRRPCALEGHCWATLLPPDQFSFPSGHSMTAFAICVPVGMFYPLLAPGLTVCAILVAASRILLGMHFLSDVVVGSVLGALLGYASYALFMV